MNYEHIWKKALNEDERVVFEFSIGGGYLTYNFLVWLFLTIPMMIGPLLWPRLPDYPFLLFVSGGGALLLLFAIFHFWFYLRVANAYAFTTKRILIHQGWLSTRTTSISYDKITDITVHEPFVERLLMRTGYISINTAGTHIHEIRLKHIAYPYKVKKELDGARDQYQRRYHHPENGT